LSLKSLCKDSYLARMFSWSKMSRLKPLTFFSRVWPALVLSSALVLYSFPQSFAASSPMPGEERSGLFYAITHLPLFVYGILFLIFCLSVVNFVLQFKPVRIWGWALRFRRTDDPRGIVTRSMSHDEKPAGRRRPQSLTTYKKLQEPLDDGIVAVRALDNDAEASSLFPPTPLDGANHPLPKFGAKKEMQPSDPQAIENAGSSGQTAKEFRFSSAVDVPSQEEIERREKERLVVSGFILGPDGKPMESAVVYLADREGTKIGQSCRSNGENGSFKVLVHETGSYLLHVYKRGYAMQDGEPIPIPVETGKFEGVIVTLAPQGCLIQGRVIHEDGSIPAADIKIKCVCRSDNFIGTATTDEDGAFKLSTVPMNSECHLEVVDKEGTLLAKTDGFQTVQKKQLYREIKIPSSGFASYEDSAEVLNPFLESKQDGTRNDDIIVVSGS
jgi:hypothetical protein